MMYGPFKHTSYMMYEASLLVEFRVFMASYDCFDAISAVLKAIPCASHPLRRVFPCKEC
ncbi:MAG: hypothetical protein RLZZ597_1242 [Cyanobacteriota bacterium]|jgi:hypothetical protein